MKDSNFHLLLVVDWHAQNWPVKNRGENSTQTVYFLHNYTNRNLHLEMRFLAAYLAACQFDTGQG
jgi:hypothetical protein